MINGVSSYAHGVAAVDVYFPDGRVDCKHCPYIRYRGEPTFTCYCALIPTYTAIDRSDLDQRHFECPVVMED